MSIQSWWNRYRPKEHGLVVMTLQVAVLGSVLAANHGPAWWSGFLLVVFTPFFREIQRHMILRGDRPQDWFFALAGGGIVVGSLAVHRPDVTPVIWGLIFLLALDGWFQARTASRSLVAESLGVTGLGLMLAFVLHLGGRPWLEAFRIALGFGLVAEEGVLFVRHLAASREGRGAIKALAGFSVFATLGAFTVYPPGTALFLAVLLFGKTFLARMWRPPTTRREFRRLGWMETAYTSVFLVGWILLHRPF